MNREAALKIVLALVGLLFLPLAYPLIMFLRRDPATSMMFSLYVTLGVFMLLAIRNPSASRSLIAFTAWSSFAHAAVMGTQAMQNMVAREELVGVSVLVVIGVTLIALAPAKPACLRASRHRSITTLTSSRYLGLMDGRSGPLGQVKTRSGFCHKDQAPSPSGGLPDLSQEPMSARPARYRIE